MDVFCHLQVSPQAVIRILSIFPDDPDAVLFHPVPVCLISIGDEPALYLFHLVRIRIDEGLPVLVRDHADFCSPTLSKSSVLNEYAICATGISPVSVFDEISEIS